MRLRELLWVVLGLTLLYGGPHPALAASPTPTPEAAHAVITVKFVHDGVPVIADTSDPWTYVNGVRCQAPTPGGIGQWTSFAFGIPILPTDRTDCVKLGDAIRSCRGADMDCVAFIYDGGDKTLEVDPTPANGSNRISTHFMLGSKPVVASVLSWRSSVNGTRCNEVMSNGLVAAASNELQFFWPPSLYASGVPACMSGTVVQSFDTVEFGTVEGSFVLTGSDATFDVDVSGATVLPRTCGPSAKGLDGGIWIGLGLMFAGALTIAASRHRPLPHT